MFSARAQEVPYEELFLDAVKNLHDSSHRTYIDSSITFWRPFSQFTRRGYLKGAENSRGGKHISMHFKRSELRELNRKVRQQKPIAWPDNMLPGGRKLTSDSIEHHISYMRTPEFQKNREYRPYYYFSIPITTRNNTVAVFRLISMVRPVAGNDFIFIYVKDSTGWKRWMTVFAGAW